MPNSLEAKYLRQLEEDAESELNADPVSKYLRKIANALDPSYPVSPAGDAFLKAKGEAAKQSLAQRTADLKEAEFGLKMMEGQQKMKAFPLWEQQQQAGLEKLKVDTAAARQGMLLKNQEAFTKFFTELLPAARSTLDSLGDETEIKEQLVRSKILPGLKMTLGSLATTDKERMASDNDDYLYDLLMKPGASVKSMTPFVKYIDPAQEKAVMAVSDKKKQYEMLQEMSADTLSKAAIEVARKMRTGMPSGQFVDLPTAIKEGIEKKVITTEEATLLDDYTSHPKIPSEAKDRLYTSAGIGIKPPTLPSIPGSEGMENFLPLTPAWKAYTKASGVGFDQFMSPKVPAEVRQAAHEQAVSAWLNSRTALAASSAGATAAASARASKDVLFNTPLELVPGFNPKDHRIVDQQTGDLIKPFQSLAQIKASGREFRSLNSKEWEGLQAIREGKGLMRPWRKVADKLGAPGGEQYIRLASDTIKEYFGYTSVTTAVTALKGTILRYAVAMQGSAQNLSDADRKTVEGFLAKISDSTPLAHQRLDILETILQTMEDVALGRKTSEQVNTEGTIRKAIASENTLQFKTPAGRRTR